jgi:hypothetical protein
MRLRRQVVSMSSWVSWVSVAVAGWFVEELAAERLIGGGILGSEERGAAGKAVGEGILRRTLFAGGGAGAGGAIGGRWLVASG